MRSNRSSVCRSCRATHKGLFEIAFLAIDQWNGITFDRLLEIYTAHGHDPRAALLD